MVRKINSTWMMFFLSVSMLLIFTLLFELVALESLIENLRKLLAQTGPLAPLLFISLFALSVVFPPVSNRPFVLIAGLLFGVYVGILLIIVGATIGAAINFAIGRKYGRRWMEKRPHIQERVKNVKFLGRWHMIFLTRMFAGFTFDWFSYFLGVLGTRWWVFISATALGITPGVFAEVYAGSFLLKNPWITFLIGSLVTALSLLIYKISPKLSSSEYASDALKDKN